MTSMQKKTWVLIATICIHDRQMFGNTWSSSILTSRSLCGTYYGYFYRLILLKRSLHCGSVILDPVLASILPKAGGWMEIFFVVFLTTGSDLETYSNFLAVPREEPLPIFGSFSFGSLDECLVVGFIGDIVSLESFKNWLF
jgi:hypothetical protein